VRAKEILAFFFFFIDKNDLLILKIERERERAMGNCTTRKEREPQQDEFEALLTAKTVGGGGRSWDDIHRRQQCEFAIDLKNGKQEGWSTTAI
jgi:hypothetical protein